MFIEIVIIIQVFIKECDIHTCTMEYDSTIKRNDVLILL